MLRIPFIAALIFIVCSPLQAYTVVFDPASTSSLRVVNRIDDLVIDVSGFSGTFDVVFTSDSFNTGQPSGIYPIYDQGLGQGVASAVVGGIIEILNTTDANKVGSVSANGGVFYLPYADDTLANNVLSNRGQYFSTTGPWQDFGPASISKNGGFILAALVPVPLPAALPLFLGGLVGLAGLARRSKAG